MGLKDALSIYREKRRAGAIPSIKDSLLSDLEKQNTVRTSESKTAPVSSQLLASVELDSNLNPRKQLLGQVGEDFIRAQEETDPELTDEEIADELEEIASLKLAKEESRKCPKCGFDFRFYIRSLKGLSQRQLEIVIQHMRRKHWDLQTLDR